MLLASAPTATELVARYRSGETTPTAVVDEHLDRIAETEGELNGFVVVDADGARAQAAAATQRWERGTPAGPLDGVPVTVKDIVGMAGFPLREGSAVTSTEPLTQDSPPVARLRQAGAVFLGKTTTSEFGWKGMTDSPAFGVTRNPHDLTRTPGGSSGGAGASLAAGVGAVAFGNDGGGSIRIPSSYCGLVGLKPSFGRVPQAPVESPYITLVSGGALTRSVADTALTLGVLSRPDRRDWYALPYDDRDWVGVIDNGVAGWRIGYTDELGGAATHPEVAAACASAMAAFTAAGATITRVGTVFDPLRPQFEDYWKAGFASRLRTIPEDRWDELDPGFRDLAVAGLDVNIEAYGRAVGARARLGVAMNDFHSEYDLLVTPTMPTVAPRADTVYHSAEFDRWEHAVPFTVPFNLTGQPAGSMPWATSEAGLPIGLQLVGPMHRDDMVLRAMRIVENGASSAGSFGAMDKPPPNPTKILEVWMEWERGEITPGALMKEFKLAGMRELLEEMVDVPS